MIQRRTFGRIELDLRSAGADGGIPCVLATNAPIDRGGYKEVLDHSPASIDLTRAAQGLALLMFHDQTKPVGRIEGIKTDGSKLSGIARFGSGPDAQQAKADVEAGILPALSVGYRIAATEYEAGGVTRITSWEPLEASLVPVPADTGAGMYRHIPLKEQNQMQSEHRTEIETLAKRHAVPVEFSEKLIADNVTLDAARSAILDHIAAREAGGTAARLPHGGHSTSTSTVADALDARFGIRGAKGDNRSLIEIAANCLEAAGQHIDRRMSRQEIATRALSTSDFPALLASTAGRALAQAYEAVPAALKVVSREVSLPDFRARSVVRLGATPSLELVNELGEFTYGAASDASANYKLSTYGRIISLARQAIVNDDLGAFADLLNKFGASASRKEGDLLAALVLSNPTVDAVAMFHASRNTLLTGAGSALASAGIAAAIKALRLQKEVDGGFIQQNPSFLVVPAALELTARQAVFAIAPTKTSDANPLEQGLSVVVEPRLDANSTTAWYLVASAGSNSLEHAYLEGENGVYVETRTGFETDGMDIKARLDFGCGFVAPTGWIKSAGV